MRQTALQYAGSPLWLGNSGPAPFADSRSTAGQPSSQHADTVHTEWWIHLADLILLACRSNGLDLCIPVGILHAAAFLMGYVVSKAVGFTEGVARTVSIETGTCCCRGSAFHMWHAAFAPARALHSFSCI